MVGKTTVSILHEYCAKKKELTPKYEWIDAPKGMFTCRVYAMQINSDGSARSKRDAKHAAAANALRILRENFKDVDEILKSELVDLNEAPTRDAITKLRNYCVQNNHPLPTFEVTREGPRKLVATCTIATIQRTGVSDKKKEAQQKAATVMLNVIQDPDALKESKKVSLEKKMVDAEYERYKKFKTYRELTENRVSGPPDVSLGDRHNYFANLYDSVKLNAKKVLNDIYDDEKQQVMDLFKALKITPSIKKSSALNTDEHIVIVDVDCDYDAHFVDLESNIYSNILEYFRDMLD